jgi:hypothetical protein
VPIGTRVATFLFVDPFFFGVAAAGRELGDGSARASAMSIRVASKAESTTEVPLFLADAIVPLI